MAVTTEGVVDVLDARGWPRHTWIPQTRTVEVPEDVCRDLGLNLNLRWCATMLVWFDWGYTWGDYRPFDRRYDRKIPDPEEWFSGVRVGGVKC